MWWLIEELESIRRFLGMGGDVLMAIFVLSLMLWTVYARTLVLLCRRPATGDEKSRGTMVGTARTPKLECQK